MAKVSIIIPARNEKHLNRTVDSLIKNATGEIEILVVLDGSTSYPVPSDIKPVRILSNSRPLGMRACINAAAKVATGKYLMKIDSHEAVSPGYDQILASDCLDNWVVIPRRYDLNPETWSPLTRTLVDYFYLSCPWTNPKMFLLTSHPWVKRTRNRIDLHVDETLTLNGSCWFTSARHFWNNLDGMQEDGYGSFAGEPQEIGMKTWLGGGKLMVNKLAWHAHLRGNPRGWNLNDVQMWDGLVWAARYWTENRWEKRIHDFDWLVERFWPLPTTSTLERGEKYSWPENWKELYERSLHDSAVLRDRQVSAN